MRASVSVRLQKSILVLAIMAIVALAAVDWRIAYEPPMDLARSETVGKPQSADAPLPLAPAAANAIENKDYSSILRRPLFDPTRRTPVVAAKPTPAAPKPNLPPFPADKYKLVGLLRSPGEPPKALIRLSATEPGLWVTEGGNIGGWRVERVGDDKVTFSANGVSGMLKLVAVQTAGDASPVPAPPPLTPAPTPAATAAPQKAAMAPGKK